MKSKEIKDIYSTFEPQRSYQSRILFLNNIFVESQKSMKYSSQQEKAKKDIKELIPNNNLPNILLYHSPIFDLEDLPDLNINLFPEDTRRSMVSELALQKKEL